LRCRKFKRIAITEQDLPSLPYFDTDTKKDDKRFDWYKANTPADPTKSWELDAMDPNNLRERVREQIESCLDLPSWEHAKQVEMAEVESMNSFHRAWESRLSQLEGGAV